MHPASVGPYQIERELGRGGMGVVFLATDSRLVRRVAIKSLPPEVASEPARLARFQREAKVLASLNHPGIGAIYGFEEIAGTHYLILEYVEGQTLAERLKRGAVPVAEALAIARQIAESLEAAHDKGVVHRDLKPGNVMVTPDGAAKVLDFGLARADDGASASSHAGLSPDSPTLTTPASPTVAGVILGSPGYMSPEQALGKSVDKRSDIFSFGCVLYEMLTGERAFSGENAAAALAAVLHVEPDWSALPASTPPRVRELLASTLQKDRRQRLHDIGDARLALERAIQGHEWTPTASTVAPPARLGGPPALLAWSLVVVSCGLAAGSLWRARAVSTPGTGSSTAAPVRLRIDDPAAPPSTQSDNGGIAISSDGALVAYVAVPPGEGWNLTLRRLGESQPQRLGLVASDVVISPDATRVAYIRGNGLWVAPASGGEPARLLEADGGVVMKGAAWGPQGIVLCPGPTSGLVLVPESGEARTLTTPDPARNEISHRWPDVLPGGRRILMTVKKSDIRTFDDAEIALLDLDTGTWKTIITGGTYGRYVPTGHIVFARNASIMAVPFDLASGEVTGTPVAAVNGVMMSPGSGNARFAIARDAGTLVYVPGGLDEERHELLWIDAHGVVEPVGAPVMPYFICQLSPDGTRIATSVYGASDAVFVYDLARRTNTRVTLRGNCSYGVWMPDSTQVAFVSDADGPPALYVTSADGGGNAEKVLDIRVRGVRDISLVNGQPVSVYEEGGDIWLQALRSTEREKLVGTPFVESAPHVSPDGKWLSYVSNESGQEEVYVRPLRGGGRWQVSRGTPFNSWWSPDGSTIFCADAERHVFSASFRPDPTGRMQIGDLQRLFAIPSEVRVPVPQPHPDGKRFLAMRELPPKFRAEQVCVVLNWFDELKAKVPTGPR